MFPLLSIYGYHAYNHYENLGSMYIHRPDPKRSTAGNFLHMLRPDGKYTKIEENVFLVITDSLKAEKVSQFLTFAFDSVSAKFYAEHDLTRGYMILQGDEFAGKRVNFVHSTISVIFNNPEKYKDISQVLNSLVQLKNIANLPNKSNYLIERPKITGKNSIDKFEYNNKIIIYESL